MIFNANVPLKDAERGHKIFGPSYMWPMLMESNISHSVFLREMNSTKQLAQHAGSSDSCLTWRSTSTPSK